MSTMAQRLQTALTNIQNLTISNTSYFLATSTKTSLERWLTQVSLHGKNKAVLHITTKINPIQHHVGNLSITGELGIVHYPQPAGVMVRNHIGWVYLATEILTIDQFREEVNNFITDLVVNEGMTISANVGANMADLMISW